MHVLYMELVAFALFEYVRTQKETVRGHYKGWSRFPSYSYLLLHVVDLSPCL